MNKILDPFVSEHGQNQHSNQSVETGSTSSTKPVEPVDTVVSTDSSLDSTNASIKANANLQDLPPELESTVGKFEFDSLEKVRNRLIDLSRNNNLINFKPQRSLSILDVSLESLFKKLSNASKELTVRENKPITYGDLLNYLKFLDQHPQHAAQFYGLTVDANGKLLFNENQTLNLPVVINPLLQKTHLPTTANNAGQFDIRVRKSNKASLTTISATTPKAAHSSADQVANNSISQSTASARADAGSALSSSSSSTSEAAPHLGIFGNDALNHTDSPELDQYAAQLAQANMTTDDDWDDEFDEDQAQQTLLSLTGQDATSDLASNHIVTKTADDPSAHTSLGGDLDTLDLGGKDYTDPQEFAKLQPGSPELAHVVQALNSHAQLSFNQKEYQAGLRNNFLRPFMRGLMFSPMLALRLLIVNPRARIRFFNQVELDTPVLQDLQKLINPQSYTYSQYTHSFYLGLENKEAGATDTKVNVATSALAKSSTESSAESSVESSVEANSDANVVPTAKPFNLQDYLLDLAPQKPLKLARLGSSLYLGDLNWRSATQLAKFYADNNKSIREMGAGILYLSLGLLEYVDLDNRNIFAPLFLIPLEINQNRRSNTEPSYTLSYTGEELVENVSLYEKLLKDLNIYLPKLNIKENLQQEQLKLRQGRLSPFTAEQIAEQLAQVENDQTYDLVTYIKLVQQVIDLEKLNCAIHEQAYVATFQFAKQRMYMDLDPSQWPSTARLEDNAVINSLFNERTGVKEFEVGETKEEYDIDNIDNVHELYPILNEADSSQHSALIDVLQGKNLVIEGPPGSGKSQTITNIIAAAMKQGKKILFVAEKMAALEVVYRRLHQMGLSDFCLEMHEPHSLRRRVIDSICNRLDTVKKYPPCENFNQLVHVYEQLKTALNNYAYGINAQYANSGFTKQQILACASYYRKFEFKNGGLGLFNPEVLSNATQISNFFNKTNYNVICGELDSFTSILLDLKASLKRQYRYLNLQQLVSNFNLDLLSRATISSHQGFTTAFDLEQAETKFKSAQTSAETTSATNLTTTSNSNTSASAHAQTPTQSQLDNQQQTSNLVNNVANLEADSEEQASRTTEFRVKDHLWYGIRARNLTGLDAKEVVNSLYAWQQSLVKIKDFLQQLITSLKAEQSLDKVKSQVNSPDLVLDPTEYNDVNFLNDFNDFIGAQEVASKTKSSLAADLGLETEADTATSSTPIVAPLNPLSTGQSGFSGFGKKAGLDSSSTLTGISAHNLGHNQTIEQVITDQDQEFKQLATNLELAQLDLHSLEIFAQNFAQLPIESLSEVLDFKLVQQLLDNPIQTLSLFQTIEQDLLSLDRTLRFNDPHLNELINFAYLEAVKVAGEQASTSTDGEQATTVLEKTTVRGHASQATKQIIAKLDYNAIEFNRADSYKVYGFSERQQLLTNPYVAKLFETVRKHFELLHKYVYNPSSLTQLESLTHSLSLYLERESENQRTVSKFMGELSKCLTGKLSLNYQHLVNLSALLEQLPPELVKYRHPCLVSPAFSTHFGELEKAIAKLNFEFTTLSMEYDLGEITDYADFCKLRDAILNKPGFFSRLFDSNYKAEHKRYLNVCRGVEFDDLTNERILARIESYFGKIEELNQNSGFAQFFGEIYEGVGTNMNNLLALRQWSEQVSELCRNEINNSALSPILVAQLSDTDYFNLVELGRLIRTDFERLHQALTEVNTYLLNPITSYDSMSKFAQQAIPGCNLISKLLVKDFNGVNLDKLLRDGIDLFYQAQQHNLANNEFKSSLISSKDVDTLANYEMSLAQMHDLIMAGVYADDFEISEFINSPAYHQIFGSNNDIDLNQFIPGVDANVKTAVNTSVKRNQNTPFVNFAETVSEQADISHNFVVRSAYSFNQPTAESNTFSLISDKDKVYIQQIERNIKRLINEKPAVLNIAVNWYITQQLIELAYLLANIKAKYGSALELDPYALTKLLEDSSLGKTFSAVLEQARKQDSVGANLIAELGDLDLTQFSGKASLTTTDHSELNPEQAEREVAGANASVDYETINSSTESGSTDSQSTANGMINESNAFVDLSDTSDLMSSVTTDQANYVVNATNAVNTDSSTTTSPTKVNPTNTSSTTSDPNLEFGDEDLVELEQLDLDHTLATDSTQSSATEVDFSQASISLGLFADLLSLFAHCSSWRSLQGIQLKMTDLEDNITKARQSYNEFKEYTDLEDSLWLGKHTNSIVDLIIRNQLALDCEDALIQWLDYLHATRRLFELKVGRISYFAEHVVTLEAHTLCEIFNQVFFNYLASLVIASTPVLKDFSSMNHNALILKFNQADDNLKLAQRVYAAYKIDSNVSLMPGNFSRKPAELTEMALLNYMKDHRNLRASLRDILYRAGHSIQSLKPCFMMSPASVAQYLTPGCLEFDLMVMDEASQVTPEDALGAIARCKQVVIVGDPKQLPPTNFFGRHDNVDDDTLSVTETAESILDVATTMFPTRVLRWHYRSQHQSLIAFSNQQYYNRRLVIFPSPYNNHPHYGVKYHYVNGAFNYKRGNVEEAKVVAQAIAQHILANPNETLGVVAMNVRQADTIERELNKLAANNPQLEQALTANSQLSEPLFIKNLENVQGDERDVIMISCTYGPSKVGDSKVPQRFGPINGQSGGKRLNVLFTRSKKRMEVYSSMHYDDIQYNPSRTDSGVNDFHSFLKYAQTGVLPSADYADVSHQEDHLASTQHSDKISSAISEMLAHHYQVDCGIGVTGYKLDMAFTRADSNSYILGLETDGQSYVEARSARDRDRLRSMVLNRLGWKLERLWTMDWFKYSHSEIVTDLKHMLDQL